MDRAVTPQDQLRIFPGAIGRSVLMVETDWWQMGHELVVLTAKRLDVAEELRRTGIVGKVGQFRDSDAPSHGLATAILSTEGCWEITGKIYGRDDSALTFVVDVKNPK
jgi:hypothetical protein